LRPLSEPLPTEPIANVRCACDFINVIERNVTALPLHDELQSLTDSPTIDRLLVDNDDSARCEEILEYAFTLYLQGAQESVQKDPPAALDAFWHALVEFDRKSRSFRADPRQSMAAVNAGRAVQILRGCLFGVGEIVLDPLYKVSSQRLQQFLNRFWELASSAAVLAPAVENLRRKLMVARIRNHRLELHKTPAHSRLQEWLLNRNRIERESVRRVSDDELFSSASAQAQKFWLGFSPNQIARALFADRHHVLKDLADLSEETVYAIPRSRCPTEVQSFFEKFSLLQERVRRFDEPLYWDLGTVSETTDSAEVIARLGRRNWLNYYPVMSGVSGRFPCFLVSAEALTHAVAGLESLKNGLLQRISDEIKEGSPANQELRRSISHLRVATNRKFETLAETLGRELGFEVASGLERLDEKPLDGGEIDLFWAARLDGRLVLILGEVKDFDVPLHRVGSDTTLQGKIAAAERQIDRKAATVRGLWRKLLPIISDRRLCSVNEPAVLAKILLTSTYLPPHMPKKYPAFTLRELDRFVAEARTWPEAFPPRFKEHGVELLP